MKEELHFGKTITPSACRDSKALFIPVSEALRQVHVCCYTLVEILVLEVSVPY